MSTPPGNGTSGSGSGSGNSDGNGVEGRRSLDVTVSDAPDQHRYEAHVGDDLAGSAVYLRTPDMIVFVHTEVADAYEGRGVGSALAHGALDQARDQGLRVVAICPFIEGWMNRHPEYDTLRYEAASRVSD